ncbi:ABC transporter transmembrane domain-containing protein [Vibrio navarrensis]|uniref:ABC transporter transmembrane domain-containing protein n=1 Tax=Vibrio navarrensis TaxID=29495 RepID=UPI001D04600B|nr:ABC transporter transmembrane domain-containing protein [Vibrio navarrensis]
MHTEGLIDWGWGKKLPLIRQTEKAECGIACLAMVADWHGYKTDLRSLRAKCGITQHGMSFARLIECGSLLKLSGRAVRLDLHELEQLATPCILHWNLNHFVVLKKVNGKKIEIHDPANGALTLSHDEVNKHFTGIALELTPTHDFEEKVESKAVRLSTLIGKTVGLKGALGRIFVFALVLEVLALTLPIFNQIVIDEVLVGYDKNLLVLVIGAILMVTATQTLIGLAQQWATIKLSVNFNMQWAANVFHHLFRLPIDWFEKRDIGSISAKFSAVDVIQQTLTTSAIQALLDLVLVIGTLSVMLVYNPQLSLIAIAAALGYVALRFAWFGAFKRAEENTWEASTQEESYFIETVRGVLSLRVNGTLPWRESSWRNLNINRRNAQLHEQKLGMIYNIMNVTLVSLVSATVLWFGANLVLDGLFTIGMLMAFLSYQGRFSASISSLINKYFEFIVIDSGCYIESSHLPAFPSGVTKLTSVSVNDKPYGKIVIGKGCVLQGTSICAYEKVSIGNNVIFGPNTVIMDCSGHALTNRGHPDELDKLKAEPVKIGNDVWIGYGCIILPGVSIDDGAVIGAGSVVTKDIPANCMAAGNPCTVKKWN